MGLMVKKARLCYSFFLMGGFSGFAFQRFFSISAFFGNNRTAMNLVFFHRNLDTFYSGFRMTCDRKWSNVYLLEIVASQRDLWKKKTALCASKHGKSEGLR